MCGISGIYHLDDRPIPLEFLRSMVGMLEHRGPDAHGVSHLGSVGLGHTRLSIIDFDGGSQPMSTPDGRLSITFNGEIYNHIELRRELMTLGRRFVSNSDTEVLLAAFDEWGDDFTSRLNGQWAFAIWDSARRRLFFSRDRVGKRPLFYSQIGKTFLFASEIKALFAHPDVRREIDPAGLDQVFTFWSTVGDRTVFRGVKQLPPAHSMVVSDEGVRQWRYWDFDFSNVCRDTSVADLERDLLERLREAVTLRLRSDVPVAAYLSGGLDSAITAALAKQVGVENLHTFSVEFDDVEFDESGYQREVALALRTNHRSVRCSHDDIGRVFPEVIRHTESPVLRTAPAPLFLLSRLVRDSGVKVVLTGEGADEVLGGYDIFKEAKLRRFWSHQPESLSRADLLRQLYPYQKSLQSQPLAYLRAFFHVGPQHLSSPFFSHLPRWEMTAQIKSLFNRDVLFATFRDDPLVSAEQLLPAGFHCWAPFSQSQYLESSSLLPGCLLSSQGDRVSMAHGVECRSPFLDRELIEFASRIPSRLKMCGLDEKHILKRAARGLVPESILRRSKQPYRAPDSASFFHFGTGRARFDYVDEMLSSRKLSEFGVFEPESVARLVEKARKGRAIGVRDNMALVGVLSTQLLVDQFIRSPIRSNSQVRAAQGVLRTEVGCEVESQTDLRTVAVMPRKVEHACY